jgi:hypothetical protein
VVYIVWPFVPCFKTSLYVNAHRLRICAYVLVGRRRRSKGGNELESKNRMSFLVNHKYAKRRPIIIAITKRKRANNHSSIPLMLPTSPILYRRTLKIISV